MVKIKTFALQQTVLKIEKTSYRWRKHLQKYISDREGLVFKTYKEFSKLNVKKKKKLNSKSTNNPVRKWTKDMKRQFMEDIHTYAPEIRT